MKPSKSPLIIFLLLVKSSHPWSPDFLFNTVVEHTKLIQTQEFLMFYCKTCRDERIDHAVGRIHRAVGITQYVTTNFTNYSLRYTAKRNYWAMIFTHSIDDFIFKVHDKILLGWHYYMGMVVLLDPVDDLQVINQLLFYMYKKRFTNTHVYFACSNLTNHFYGFWTYPRFEIDNRTQFTLTLKAAKKYLEGGVFGYAFRTPLEADVPRVFKFTNRAGQMQVQGTSYRIFKTFAKHVHGIIEEYPMNVSTNAVNMREVLQLIRDEKIDISAHAYALFNKSGIDQSYPLLVVRWCIMVPSFNQITSYLYPIKPFELRVWLLYFVAILSFIVTSYCYEKLVLGKDSLIANTLVGFCLMLNIAAPRTFKDPSKWEFFLFSIIFLHTAAVTFFYTSFLGSILTVNLFRQQINTMEDLVAANLRVMIIDYEYEYLRAFTPLLPEFEKLIYPVDPNTFSQHRDSMNTSFAYVLTDDRWHFIDVQQKYLKHPKFRLSDICFGSFHMGFPMQIDSPVWRELEYFIYRIHSSGLYHYYESIAYDYAVQGGYAHRLTSVNEYQSAGMDHLLMAFQLLVVLWIVGLVFFACELIIGNRNKKK